MSHSRRSNFGRFTSTTASESFQRQLTAPVHKWKKQWVSPKGLAPESSYKICKWVKSQEKAKLVGATSEVGDEETPAPDGDVDVDEEDEGEDGDEIMEDDEGEGEEGADVEGEGEAEGEGEEDETKPPTETLAPEGPTEPPTPLETPDHELATPMLAPSSAVAEGGIEAEPVSAIASAPATAADELTHEATIPPHTDIPSNAMEVTNTSPFHTELGKANLGASEPGVEITTRHAEDAVPETTDETKEDERMDVEGEDTPLEKDEGLVMGEMEPPAPELAVEGGDVPPSEVET
ncbi:hypothetical protein IAR55_001053 [Kwoniella newhampshirensis]|uniref:Uncharacterized protein n=1 Tax=Kwoniella newhampshirensis TaxID=1651941 RepID=A0AAW0Z4R2_9TREE